MILSTSGGARNGWDKKDNEKLSDYKSLWYEAQLFVIGRSSSKYANLDLRWGIRANENDFV